MMWVYVGSDRRVEQHIEYIRSMLACWRTLQLNCYCARVRLRTRDVAAVPTRLLRSVLEDAVAHHFFVTGVEQSRGPKWDDQLLFV
eukprot:354832-Amphidinium_carterae.1